MKIMYLVEFLLKNKYILVLALVGTVLYSCIKPEQVSPIPNIKFKSFIKFGLDSADFTISFKDGDGDIGLDPQDTFPPYNTGTETYYNLFMKYYFKKTDGSFVAYYNPNTNDTLVFKYRIPDITPIGQNKTLDGDIKVKLSAPYFVPGHTVFKFDVYIYDRALNKSNVITTPEITAP
jgi:hypothetical protein